LRSGDCLEGPSAGNGAGADRGCCSRPSCENERNRPPEPIQGGPPLGSDDALPSSARGNTGNRTRSTKLVPAAVRLGNRWRSMRNSRPRERRFPSENWPVLAERSTRGSQGTRHAASGSQILHRNPSRKAGAQALSPAPPPPPTHPCRDPQASPNHRRRETAPPNPRKSPKEIRSAKPWDPNRQNLRKHNREPYPRRRRKAQPRTLPRKTRKSPTGNHTDPRRGKA
jgi:hypothetical protein